MFKNQLHEWRMGIGYTQANFASAVGMPLRTYQAIEDGVNPIKPYHLNAAKFALIEYAAGNGGYDKLPFELGEIVRRAAKK